MTKEGEQEVDEEKQEKGKRHFFDKLAPAAKKVAKVVNKVTAGKKDDKKDKDKDKKDEKKDQQQNKNPDRAEDKPAGDKDKDQQGKNEQKKAGGQMTREQAEKLLEAARSEEQKTNQKVQQKQVKPVNVKIQKDW